MLGKGVGENRIELIQRSVGNCCLFPYSNPALSVIEEVLPSDRV